MSSRRAVIFPSLAAAGMLLLLAVAVFAQNRVPALPPAATPSELVPSPALPAPAATQTPAAAPTQRTQAIPAPTISSPALPAPAPTASPTPAPAKPTPEPAGERDSMLEFRPGPPSSPAPPAQALPSTGHVTPIRAAFPGGPEMPALFRIGYLRPAPESALDPQWYQDLRKTLLADKEFAAALREAGFTDVALRPCEGPEDMLQRIDQMEFELAFCPTMVYVQQRAARPRDYAYHVFLQTRRQYLDSHGGQHVLQKGVLFVRRGSPLDKEGTGLNPDAVAKFVSNEYLAVSGRYDAAGYFDVRKLLYDDFSHAIPGSPLFCGSPQEVVKTVVSGVAEIGACEEETLKEAFEAFPSGAADSAAFIRIIGKTRGVPTDPVVIQTPYDPLITSSPLGIAAARVLKKVYGKPEKGVPVLENSNDTLYDAVADDVRRLQGQGVVW